MTTEELWGMLDRADRAGDADAARDIMIMIREAESSDGGQGFSFGEMASNIPGSAAQFVQDTAYPILHPIQTVQSLGNLARGVYQKFVPGEQPQEVYADAAGQFFKDRYGSMDAAKQTLQTDPVGALADVSGLLTGGGTALAKAGPVAKAARTAGAALDPVNVARNTVGGTVGLLTPEALPRTLYDSAAKWRPSLNKKQRAEMTETALDEGLMPSSRGVSKTVDLVVDLNAQVDDLIDAANAANRPVDKADLQRSIAAVKQKLGGVKINAPSDLGVVDDVVREWDDYLASIGKDKISVRELQEFKKDVYTRVNWSLEQGQANFAKNETHKAMARDAKELIEQQAPEVKDLNRREGRLLEILPELERAASRIENRDMVGIGLPLKSMMGGAALDGPGAALGAMAGLLDTPKLKAYAALKLESLRRQGLLGGFLDNSVPASLLTQGLFQSGRFSRE